MDWFKCYNLIKDGDGYVLEICLNPHAAEFSKELDSSFKEKVLGLDEQIGHLIKERFSDIKINTVKLLLGTIAVASIPFAVPLKVKAAITTGAQHAAAASTITVLNTTGVVTAGRLNVRQGPSTNYGVIHKLWLGNKVKVIGKLGSWYKIQLSDGRTGWVSGTYLRVNDRQQLVNTVISTAKSLIGTPYVWGGESPGEGGFDCSGFTQYVFKQVGYSLNRISGDQAKQGVYVSRASIQPGDLIFYSFEGNGVINHVGIYIGNGQMIHSPKAGDSVKITNIGTAYWRSRYVTARRIIR
jgi:cell wall-associated NlpC family hydrolase